ncbi:MAG: ATP-binding protein [Candidatus Methylumidiphilus sp.]
MTVAEDDAARLAAGDTASHRLFERMPTGFAHGRAVGVPDDFVFLGVNPSFERLTGLRGVVGQRAGALGLRETQPTLCAAVGRVVACGLPERVRAHAQDSARWLAVSLHSPGPGEFVALVELADAATPGQAGAAGEAERLSLESLLAERAAAAEAAANRIKSHFLANISHEIRTPMNAIVGLSYLLRRAEPRPDQLDKLDKITQAADRLLSIINDILYLSNIEAGGLALVARDFELGHLLAGISRLAQDKLAGKPITFATDIDRRLPKCLHGDEARLAQALAAYVDNAAKFTASGEIVLRCRATRETAHQLWLRFELQDSGIGLSAEQCAAVFQAFEQANGSSTRPHGGAGIGLALARRLAELMGGNVGVHSEPGHGSVFWLTVPLRKLASPQPRAPAASPHAACVLLAADAAGHAAIAQWLSGVGAQVDCAENAALAVEMAGRTPYDLILLDMHVPALGGLALARAIRRLPGRADTPLVAITASDEDRPHCLAAGLDGQVAKQADAQVLSAALLPWLPTRAAPAAAAAPPPTDSLLEGLRQIEGLAVDKGLKSVRGDAAAYLRLLRTYAAGHAGDVAAVRGCVGDGDFRKASRIAHDLKTAAGLLGAVEIQKLAGTLASTLREQRGAEAESLCATLESAQARLCAAIAWPTAPAHAEEGENWNDIAGILDRLETLLAEHNMRANALMAASAGELALIFGEPAAALGRQIAAFDYPQALRTLRQMRDGGRLDGAG